MDCIASLPSVRHWKRFNFLFPNVLRNWPIGAGTQDRLKALQGSWVNFYHVWDPISSRLLASRFANFVSNRHSKLFRVPVLAHTSYWHDNNILKYLVSRAYGHDLCPWPDPKFINERLCSILRHVTGWITLTVALLTIPLMLRWIYTGGGLSALWVLVKSWFGDLP